MTALRLAFMALVVRPLVLLLIGLHVRGREHLPKRGPAIVVANHNSHLDTLVLLSLFPLLQLKRVRPVAAADYFLGRGALSWIALHLVGIIPIRRGGAAARPGHDPLLPLVAALDRGDILLIYPEGTRGEPEKLERFKGGVAHLVRRRPDVPVTPACLRGLGKAWPKGERWPVPLMCEVFLGPALAWSGERAAFLAALEARIAEMAKLGEFPGWDDEPSAAEEKRRLADNEGGRG
jgi:1-acyl-sn-glycerol-3-phosphate acyltransferase